MKFSKVLLPILLSAAVYHSRGFAQENPHFWQTIPIKKILPNGLVIIHHRDESSPITTLQILIKGGVAADPEGKEGLAYLTTRLAIEIPDRGKAQQLMKHASWISMSCRGDYSLINITCLTSHLEDTLKITSKIIQKPLFSGLRISRIKEYMGFRIKAADDNPILMEHNAHLKSFFGNTGYGSPVFGLEESLKRIKKKDIENFYKKYFTAENMIVSASSELEDDALIDILEKYLSRIPRGTPADIHPDGPSIPQENYLFLEKDTEQSLVSIAFPLPELSARNFILSLMIETLLGKGINSRLWHLRSQEKLAYNVDSQVTQMKEGGIIRAYLETKNKNREFALDSLHNIVQTLYEQGITEDEFQETKINAKANFLRMNEEKEARVSTMAYFESLGLGYNFINQFFKDIDALSLEEINSFIKEILDPDKSMEIIVGPEEVKSEK